MSDHTAMAFPGLDLARIERIRQHFPILARQVGDKPLVYLDNAATSQKPEAVLKMMDDYYRRYNANVHRGVHKLSEEATAAYEQARLKVARFIHAPSDKQIIFTRGTTEGINLGGAKLGTCQSWPWRRSADHRDGASQQHRAVANPARPNWLYPALYPADRWRRA